MKKRISKYTPRGHRLSVRRSLAGKGLFTEEDIPKGVCVIEYTGRILHGADAEGRGGRYLFEVDARTTIDGNVPSNPARYINHSCRPNCEAVVRSGRVFIFSRRRIKAGSELSYDYGKEYFDEFIKPHGCRCEKHREKK
jgi:SET domain-containing protein